MTPKSSDLSGDPESFNFNSFIVIPILQISTESTLFPFMVLPGDERDRIHRQKKKDTKT